MGKITWQRIRGISAPIPVLDQRQDSLDEQLTDLYAVANALGMYDAADWIKHHQEHKYTGTFTSGEDMMRQAIAEHGACAQCGGLYNSSRHIDGCLRRQAEAEDRLRATPDFIIDAHQRAVTRDLS